MIMTIFKRKKKKLSRAEIKAILVEIYPTRNETEKNRKEYQSYIRMLNKMGNG